MATIIIHEFLHVLFHASRRSYDFDNLTYNAGAMIEDFFDDEIVAELGWSGESAVSSGTCMSKIILTLNPDIRRA